MLQILLAGLAVYKVVQLCTLVLGEFDRELTKPSKVYLAVLLAVAAVYVPGVKPHDVAHGVFELATATVAGATQQALRAVYALGSVKETTEPRRGRR